MNKQKTSLYLPDDLFWKFKETVAARRTTDTQALEDAVRWWIEGSSPESRTERIGTSIPRSLQATVDWVIDLFTRKGTPEKEALKNSIRVLVARREEELRK